MKRTASKWFDRLVATLIVIALLGMFSAYLWSYFGSEAYVTIKVLKSERVTQGSGDSTKSRYLVFAEGETFECTDSLFYGKFNSSDVYGSIKEGDVLRARVVGWRWEFCSCYRNILSVTKEHK